MPGLKDVLFFLVNLTFSGKPVDMIRQPITGLLLSGVMMNVILGGILFGNVAKIFVLC